MSNNLKKEFFEATYGLLISPKTARFPWMNRYYTVIHFNIHHGSRFAKNKDKNLASITPSMLKEFLQSIGGKLYANKDYIDRNGIDKIFLCKDEEMWATPFKKGDYFLLATSQDFDKDSFDAKRVETLTHCEEIKIETRERTDSVLSVNTSSTKDFPELKKIPTQKAPTEKAWVKPPAISTKDAPSNTEANPAPSPLTTVDETATIRTLDSNELASTVQILSQMTYDPRILSKYALDSKDPETFFRNIYNLYVFMMQNQGLFGLFQNYDQQPPDFGEDASVQSMTPSQVPPENVESDM